MEDSKLLEFLNEVNRFGRENGILLTDLNEEYSVAECTVTRARTNPTATLHGGMYFTLADTAGGALASRTGQACVTQNASVSFFRPALTGRVRAIARVRHAGKTTFVTEVSIFDEADKLLAVAVMTYFFVGQRVELK